MSLRDRRRSRYLRGHYLRTETGQEIAEFGAVLWVILFIFFFPFLDMVLYFASYGAVYITCNLAARAAAPTFTYSTPTTGAQAAYTNMITSPFLKAISAATRMTPSGASAYQLQVLMGSNAGPPLATIATAPGAVALPSSPPAGVFYLYQVSTVPSLTMSPIFPLPFINGGPVTFNATCFVEHPEGLGQ